MSPLDSRYRPRSLTAALRHSDESIFTAFPRPTMSARRWRNLAFGLALTAAVLAIAFSIWPIAFLPPGARRFAFLWGLVGHAAAALYLTAAYFSRRGRASV